MKVEEEEMLNGILQHFKRLKSLQLKGRDFQQKQIKAFCSNDTSIAKIVLLNFLQKVF